MMIMKEANKEKNDKIYKLSMEVAKKNDEINSLKRRLLNGEKSHDQRLYEANVKLVNDMDILKRELQMTTDERDGLVLLIKNTIKELEKRKDNELNEIINKLKKWNGEKDND